MLRYGNSVLEIRIAMLRQGISTLGIGFATLRCNIQLWKCVPVAQPICLRMLSFYFLNLKNFVHCAVKI